jgi:hypothetical protein
MNYTKPEVTSLASASFVIQSGTKKPIVSTFDGTEYLQTTPNAYEADE